MDDDTRPTDPAAPDAPCFPSHDAFGPMLLGDSPNYVPARDATTVASPATPTTEPAPSGEKEKERTK